jgi:ubiquinone/menaquinone biosynthesis C-methylase UbiE
MIKQNASISLDIGCGISPILIDLSHKNILTVGFDISPNMIANSRRMISDLKIKNVSLCIADIENIPFRIDSFDQIICAGVIEYLEKDDKALSEISRILKRKGNTIITVTNILTPFWIIETIIKKIGIFGKLFSYYTGGIPFPKSRIHNPIKFAQNAKDFGLEYKEFRYFHFSLLFFPLNIFFRKISNYIGLYLEKYSKSRFGIIARGCIIKFISKKIK